MGGGGCTQSSSPAKMVYSPWNGFLRKNRSNTWLVVFSDKLLRQLSIRFRKGIDSHHTEISHQTTGLAGGFAGNRLHFSQPRFWTKREQLGGVQGLLPRSQGQNLALTILCVPLQMVYYPWSGFLRKNRSNTWFGLEGLGFRV